MMNGTARAATLLGGGRRSLRSPSEACRIIPAERDGGVEETTIEGSTRSGTTLKSRIGSPFHHLANEMKMASQSREPRRRWEPCRSLLMCAYVVHILLIADFRMG